MQVNSASRVSRCVPREGTPAPSKRPCDIRAGRDALVKVSAIVGNSVVQPLVRYHTESVAQDHTACSSDSEFEIIHKVSVIKPSQHSTPRNKVCF
jgi:hypothetical protein